MKFENLIGVLQELGIDVSNTRIVVNWMQLAVVIFALFSILLMFKVVWKECTTRVKILAGLTTVSVLLIKFNEYLDSMFKAKKLLEYSTYTVYASILVAVSMLAFYKLYGVPRKKFFTLCKRGDVTKEPVVESEVENEEVSSTELEELIDFEDFNMEG